MYLGTGSLGPSWSRLLVEASPLTPPPPTMEEDVLEDMEDMTPDAGRNVERYSLCGADLMDTEDAPIGRVTELVGAGG